MGLIPVLQFLPSSYSVPKGQDRMTDCRACPDLSKPGAGARGFFTLVVWLLLGMQVWGGQAPTEGSAGQSDCPASDTNRPSLPAPDVAESEFEFDQTLGTSQDIDPFGPTPHEVVAQMLKMARVGKGDVVYDLGSGDGRIPIAAAQQAGAHGVGVELRPELVEQSRAAAEKAGVAERVQFLEADMFKCDIRPATVVMLYLYPRTALKLRPKLLRELRPGTRIVAYNYGIEGWPRDQEELVENTESYLDGVLYLWIVPANLSGTWQSSLETPAGESLSFTLQLDQTFQKVSGKVVHRGLELPLKDVRLSGRSLRFCLALPDGESLALAATVRGHRLQGHAQRVTTETGSEPPPTRMAWQARRDPATRTPIDPGRRRR